MVAVVDWLFKRDEEKTTKFNGVVTPVKKTDSKSITPIKVQRNNVGKNKERRQR